MPQDGVSRLGTSSEAGAKKQPSLNPAGMACFFQSSQSDSALYGGKWDEGAQSLSFEYDYPRGGRLPVVAKLAGAKLSGKIGESAEFVAERAAE